MVITQSALMDATYAASELTDSELALVWRSHAPKALRFAALKLLNDRELIDDAQLELYTAQLFCALLN
ncbi:MAG TPA: hypothetical protein VGC88_11345 [Terriglobales bacterium]|jgi:hypothetical protein